MERHSSTRNNLLHGGEGKSSSGGGGGGAVGGSGGVTSSSPTSVGRPSGVRWTPTSEQIRILRELYYGCGIRSPNAEQIQRIAARLRQYGRIEGKNVFYWFQNHKARERQKKRLTNLDVPTSAAVAAGVNHLGVLSLSPSGAAAASSAGALYHAGNGASAVQLEAGTNCWDTTGMDTERSFVQLQDYMGVRSTTGGHGGIDVSAAAPWACFPVDQTPPPMTREPETLPLFPTGGRHGGEGGSRHHHQEIVAHGGGYLQPANNFQCWGAMQHHRHHQQQQHNFCSNQLPSSQDGGGGGASLELTLSSYCSPHPAAGYM